MAKISTKALVKEFGSRRVVDHVNIEIVKGEIVGLLGPNGAGKSTTFNMIVGLIRPTEGRIFYNDQDITAMPMFKRARLGMGYLAQDVSIFRKLTVEQNIMAICETLPMTPAQRKDRLDFLLNELGVTRLAKSLAYTLSGGERRRVEIARALVTDPDFILLDEPFAGVDPKAVEDLQDIIYHMQARGLGVLITDHNVRETLNVADRTYIIHEGRVMLSGNSDELANSEEARRYYLGEHFYFDHDAMMKRRQYAKDKFEKKSAPTEQ